MKRGGGVMLTERKDVRQIDGEGYRRWFTDRFFDLIIWYEGPRMSRMTGFQLCYDKEHDERALTWRKSGGYVHNRVDDGEAPYSNKMSPVLVSDGLFSPEPVLRKFLESSSGLDRELVDFISEKLREYPG